jgi:hypothetical protein
MSELTYDDEYTVVTFTCSVCSMEKNIIEIFRAECCSMNQCLSCTMELRQCVGCGHPIDVILSPRTHTPPTRRRKRRIDDEENPYMSCCFIVLMIMIVVFIGTLTAVIMQF